jgi:methylisocitrate lyase
MSQGTKFKEAVQQEIPLQIPGTLNALSALMAQQTGFRAIYLSGAGVANASHGLPDLGITSRNDVLEEARKITSAVDIPLLADIDTGWGDWFSIGKTIRDMIQAGVAAVHIEDQIANKRCGHRPGKQLTDTEDMCNRIRAALDARTDPDFVIMARTDALATEGLPATINRIHHYADVGADMIFFEGARSLADYKAVTEACPLPVLANMTEFGVTPLYTATELGKAGIRLVLYPLSAFRAMNAAALSVYQTVRQTGSQKDQLDAMQTREALYSLIDYYRFEKKMDALSKKE